jgi:hypothetical protein
VLETMGVISKSRAALATFKTKNLTSAVHSNNCMAIANHFIMRLNPGFKTVDLKYLMTRI